MTTVTCIYTRVISFAISIFLFFPALLYSQSPQIDWQRPLGGSGDDFHESNIGKHLLTTSDGGYVLITRTNSNDGDVSGNNGELLNGQPGFSDAWVVKLNSLGTIEWQKCIGSGKDDSPFSICFTADDGYIFCGWTSSTDIPNFHGSVYDAWYGKDAWVCKLDSLGNIQWQKCYGGTDRDIATSILQTSDGGYVFTGFTGSNDGDVVGNHLSFTDSSGSYYEDAWVVKIDSIGALQWQYCAGGNKYELGCSIIQTKDGGYVIAGTTSSDEEGFGSFGGKDAYIVKLTGMGEYQWQKSFGGKGQDIANSILVTMSGNLIFAGGYDFLKTSDAWVMMLDSIGETLWEKKYGGSFGDVATTLISTAEGGYAFVGTTSSIDGDVVGKHGGDTFNSEDIWVVNIDSVGTLKWQKCLGGTSNDYGYSIVQWKVGGYTIAGSTFSFDGDILGNHSIHPNKVDTWVVKLKVSPTSVESGVSATNFAYAYPNPTSDEVQFFVSKPDEVKSVEIYSAMGTEYNPSFQIRDNVLSIDLRGLVTGTYVARITFQGEDNLRRTQTQKIIYYSK